MLAPHSSCYHFQLRQWLKRYLQSHLVGQKIHNGVQWLQLAEGVDYHSLIDLSGLFRVWNPARNEYTNVGG